MGRGAIVRSTGARIALGFAALGAAAVALGAAIGTRHRQHLLSAFSEQLSEQAQAQAARLDAELRGREGGLRALGESPPVHASGRGPPVDGALGACVFDAQGVPRLAYLDAQGSCPPPGAGVRRAGGAHGARLEVGVALSGGGSAVGAFPFEELFSPPPGEGRQLTLHWTDPATSEEAAGMMVRKAQVGARPLWVLARLDRAQALASYQISPWERAGAVAALGAFLALAVWLVSRSIGRPVRDASQAARRIAAGDFSVRLAVEGPNEARELASSVNQMTEDLKELYDTLEEQVALRSQDLTYAVDRARSLQKLAFSQSALLRARNEELQAHAAELRTKQQLLSFQNAVLEEKNHQLAKVSALKSYFLASMSHELRTPLNAVIGFSELLTGGVAGPLLERQAEYVQDILASGRHLLAMINDILDLSKIEAGQLRLHLEKVEVRKVVEETVELMRPMALKKELTLEVEATEEVYCQADPQRLKQVALNLLSNAVKFTPRGGTVTARIRGLPELSLAELEVQDTGIGIDPAHHRLIFEAFRQLDSGPSREFEGTGLGLALVARFVEAMGGAISVDSKKGEGATFLVRLPMTKGVSVPAPKEAPAAEAEERPLEVLVAEDDAANRDILATLLSSRGHQVRLAEDGDAAVAALDASLPDVLVLDLLMPGISGMEVLAHLRALPSGERTRVLILSGRDLAEEEQAALQAAGAQVFLKGEMAQRDFLAQLQAAPPAEPRAP